MENDPQPNITPSPETVVVHSTKTNPSSPLLLGGVALIAATLAGGLGYYFGSTQRTQPIVDNAPPQQETQVSSMPQAEGMVCALEAKLCPDGSSVGRVGPNCEFEECRTIEKKTMLQLVVPDNYKFLPGELRSLDIPAESRNRAEPVYMTVGGVTYQVQNTVGGSGMCPWGEETERTKCEKIEEPFPNADYLFVWKDAERGVFAFNTGNLKVGKVSTEVIIVSKKDQRGFTNSELEMWKQILQTMKAVE